MGEEWVTKSDLVERIQAARLKFDELLAVLSDHQMIEPVLDNHWSVKDVVAHITAWEQLLLAWLAAAAQGDAVQIPAPGYTWKDIDALNAHIYQEYRDRPLETVMAGHRASLEVLFAALERLSDDALNAPYFPGSKTPLWVDYAESTYLHYEEHGREILAWIEATGGRRPAR